MNMKYFLLNISFFLQLKSYSVIQIEIYSQIATGDGIRVSGGVNPDGNAGENILVPGLGGGTASAISLSAAFIVFSVLFSIVL